MIRAGFILAVVLATGPLRAGEAPKPAAPTEACSVCDLRHQAKRKLAASRQAAQSAKGDKAIIALPPAPKGD